MPVGPDNRPLKKSGELWTSQQIRDIRVSLFDDFAGSADEIARLQQRAIAGDFRQSLLFVGPYGSGKTSLARHYVNAAACDDRDPATGDSCHVCPVCRYSGPEYNGEPFGFPRYEVDCGINNTRGQLLPYVETFADLLAGAVFLDEFHAIRDHATQRMFHKISEDFPGLFIVAVTEVGHRSLSPDLFERFDKVWLTMPTPEEMVEHFQRQIVRWGVHAETALIIETVRRSEQSFRTCHKVFAAAAENPGRTLDSATIDEYLGPR